jgi:hypothetical protein
MKMSLSNLSRGNELLQELYNRLTGSWYKKGRYKNERITRQEMMALMEQILREYKEYDDAEVRQSESNNE